MSDRVASPSEIIEGCIFPEPFRLDDDDVIAAVMVIIKVVDGQGRSGVALTHDGVDWITRVGMLDFCLGVERESALRSSRDGA